MKVLVSLAIVGACLLAVPSLADEGSSAKLAEEFHAEIQGTDSVRAMMREMALSPSSTRTDKIIALEGYAEMLGRRMIISLTYAGRLTPDEMVNAIAALQGFRSAETTRYIDQLNDDVAKRKMGAR